MTTICRRCSSSSAFVILLFSLGGCEPRYDEFQLGGYRYNTQRFEQWKLPRSLREISGLAETDDGRLFAHADERATIHQIDYLSGKRLKSFSLSRQPGAGRGKAIRGDFEGIAVVDDQVYLVTSRGTIYVSRLGMDGGAESFQAHRTGLAEVCEVEGMAYHRNHNTLLLACKAVHCAELRGNVVVFQWSLDSQTIDPDATISIPLVAIASRLGGSNRFNPSGIAVSPRNGNLLLVAAHQKALLEVTMAGDLVNVFTLPMQRYHRQTEGIALFANGTLILADEGGNKRGRLGVYRATN